MSIGLSYVCWSSFLQFDFDFIYYRYANQNQIKDNNLQTYSTSFAWYSSQSRISQISVPK